MSNEIGTRTIGDLADSKQTAQAVYDALHRTRFDSFCNAVFFLTQFTQQPLEYSMNGEGPAGYEIKGKNLSAVIKDSVLKLLSILSRKEYQETCNYKLRFPVGGRVEVEILETLCKSKTCNRNFTNATLETLGVAYFDLVMMDYAN